MATPEKVARLPVDAKVRVALDKHQPKELKTATVVRLFPESVYLSLEGGQTTYVHPTQVFYDGDPLSTAPFESSGKKRKVSARSPPSSPSVDKAGPSAKRSKGNNSKPQVQTPSPPTPDADGHEATASVDGDETLALVSPAPAQDTPASNFTTETPESAAELNVAASDAEDESGSAVTGACSAIEPVSDLEGPQASLTPHTSVADQSTEPPNAKADGNDESETGEPDAASNDVSDVTQHASAITQSTASATLPPALVSSSQVAPSANSLLQSQALTLPDIRINGRAFRHPDSSLANAGDQNVALSLRMDNVIFDLEEYSELSHEEARKLSGHGKRWNFMSKIVPEFFNRYKDQPDFSAQQIKDFKYWYIKVQDIFSKADPSKSRARKQFREKFKKSWKTETLEPAAFTAQAQAQAGAETQDVEDEAED